MLPNYLHIGVAKGASTWLWTVFKDHPEIYAPEKPDNVNFFTVHYHRGLKWYEETYFSAVKGEKAVGEFSNSYIVFSPAMERIAEHLPQVKLTMTLRNPVQRAYLRRMYEFLGVDPDFETSLIGRDINPDIAGHDPAAQLTPDLKRELKEVYYPEFDELEKMLGRDLSAWRSY